MLPWSSFSSNPAAYAAQFYSDLVATLTRRPRSNLMREALLTSAVSAFEALMGDIMLGYAQTKPESMFASERKYKLHDIASFLPSKTSSLSTQSNSSETSCTRIC